MASKPGIPKGTRDFHHRGGKIIISIIIKNNFEKFSNHRNTIFENSETLREIWRGR
jgi:hypothetical protein